MRPTPIVDQIVGGAVRAGLRGPWVEDAAETVRRVLGALVRSGAVTPAARRANAAPTEPPAVVETVRAVVGSVPLERATPGLVPAGPAVETVRALEHATPVPVPAGALAPAIETAAEDDADVGPSDGDLAQVEALGEDLDDDAPSAWDPEPVSSAARAGIQGRAFEDWERARMQAGFYIDPPAPDARADDAPDGDDDAPEAETDTADETEDAEAPTRDVRRSRRRHAVRPLTISVKRLPKYELEAGRRLYPEATAHMKPRSRAECIDGPRPCPFVSCQHHLYLDVSPETGAIQLVFPDLEVEDMDESCARDVAARGGATLEAVAVMMNLTREAVRQIENKALRKLERKPSMKALAAEFDLDASAGKRRLPVVQDHGGQRQERAA